MKKELFERYQLDATIMIYYHIHVDVPTLSGAMWDDAAVYGTNFEMLCDVNTQIVIRGVRACRSEKPFASICSVEERGSSFL